MASDRSHVARADRFLRLIGASLGAKLHSQLGDQQLAIADLDAVVEVALSLREEMGAGRGRRSVPRDVTRGE